MIVVQCRGRGGAGSDSSGVPRSRFGIVASLPRRFTGKSELEAVTVPVGRRVAAVARRCGRAACGSGCVAACGSGAKARGNLSAQPLDQGALIRLGDAEAARESTDWRLGGCHDSAWRAATARLRAEVGWLDICQPEWASCRRPTRSRLALRLLQPGLLLCRKPRAAPAPSPRA